MQRVNCTISRMLAILLAWIIAISSISVPAFGSEDAIDIDNSPETVAEEIVEEENEVASEESEETSDPLAAGNANEGVSDSGRVIPEDEVSDNEVVLQEDSEETDNLEIPAEGNYMEKQPSEGELFDGDEQNISSGEYYEKPADEQIGIEEDRQESKTSGEEIEESPLPEESLQEEEQNIEETTELTSDEIRAFQEKVKIWKYNNQIIIVYDSTDDIHLEYEVFEEDNEELLCRGVLRWESENAFYWDRAYLDFKGSSNDDNGVSVDGNEVNRKIDPVRIVLNDGHNQYVELVSQNVETVTAYSYADDNDSDTVSLRWNNIAADGYLVCMVSSEEAEQIKVFSPEGTEIAVPDSMNENSMYFINGYSFNPEDGNKSFGEAFLYTEESTLKDGESTTEEQQIDVESSLQDDPLEVSEDETEEGSDANGENERDIANTNENKKSKDQIGELLEEGPLKEEIVITEPVYGGVAGTYEPREYNGHRYQLFNKATSWSAAKASCEKKGGHLVTITSAGEHSFCKTLLGSLKPKYCWIGGTHASGSWKWVTGESWTYSGWSPTQPNGSGGGTCALMQNFKGVKSAWNWDDQGNSGTSPSAKYRGAPYYHTQSYYCYICEWDYRGKMADASISNIWRCSI